MEAKRYLSIREKIGEARDLYEAWADRLCGDAGICELLGRLERNIRASTEAMRVLRVDRACKRCEEEEGGSCCGAGIENHYDPLQLLINLLLHAHLPDRKRFQDSCHFLEVDGCCLKARHVLCVNYLCSKLQQTLSREDMNALQGVIGEELETGFALHEAVRKKVGPLAGHR